MKPSSPKTGNFEGKNKTRERRSPATSLEHPDFRRPAREGSPEAEELEKIGERVAEQAFILGGRFFYGRVGRTK